MTDLIPLLIVAAALAALVIYRAWVHRMSLAAYSKYAFGEACEVVAPAINYVAKLWRFVGPRLTHKQTVAMVLANGAMLIGIDPAHMDSLTVAVWVGANLIFPPWDDLPNETLEGPRPQPSIQINGAVQVSAQ